MKPQGFLILLLGGMLACSNDDGDSFPEYPSTYEKSTTVELGELRVYDRNGLVTNTAVINRLLEFDTIDLRFMRQNVSHSGLPGSLKFQAPNSALLEYSHAKIECEFKQEDGAVVLATRGINPLCCAYEEVMSRQFRYQILKFKPEIASEYIAGVSRGSYWFGYDGNEKYVFGRRGGDLEAIVTQYIKHGSLMEYNYVFNQLEPRFFQYLKEGEMVTVLEFRVVYEKE